MSEGDWVGSGGDYSLLWGGRRWTLKVNEADWGLRSQADGWSSSVLALCGLAEAGRFETCVFTPATLIHFERYRSRVQMTFAPPDWGGLTVRAAWSPSCGGAGVDLEIQASAISVGALRDVEVVVQSRWTRVDELDLSTDMIRGVLPRDARSAALSYDGRESASDLRRLTTYPPGRLPHLRAFIPPGYQAAGRYLEMVQPNDVARTTRLETTEPELPLLEALSLRYALFGYDFEKGVVFRARLRAVWFNGLSDGDEAYSLYQDFLNEPLPLGP